jgi:uncharacterized alkaline shock family protein YloU
MNAFNRFLLAIIGAVAVVAGVWVLLVAVGLFSPGTLAPEGWFREQLQAIDDQTGGDRAVAIGAALAAAVAGLVLIALETSALWRVERFYTNDSRGKEFAIRQESVERLIDYAGRDVEGVRQVRPSLKRKNDGLYIHCHATLEPETPVSQVAPDLESRVRNAVESMTGLRVAQVNVTVDYAKPEPARRVE